MSQLVLLVDDDRKIVDTLQLYFERAGFRVAAAFSGAEALATARATPPALVVLDVMLPRGDGLEVCRALRSWSRAPILMLTARTSEDDRIRGLELGADDYVTKPFSPREVVARARAILRRADPPGADGEVLWCGDVRCDVLRHEVRVAGRLVDLTATQFDLLRTFMEQPGRAFRRHELAGRALGGGTSIDDRTVDAHIMHLRKKIDEAGGPSRIVTLFGVGYKMVVR